MEKDIGLLSVHLPSAPATTPTCFTNYMAKTFVHFTLLSVLMLTPASSVGQPVANDEGGRVLRVLTAQFQVALIRERRLADARDIRLLASSEERLKNAHAAMVAARGDARQVRGSLQAARDDFARMAEELSRKDAEIRSEAEVYRLQVADLAQSNDPELAAAVAAYADGDRVAAFPVIQRILLAQNRAAEAGVAERNAERLREVATFTFEMAQHGEKTSRDAINAWLAAQNLVPTAQVWLKLAVLYIDVGDLTSAERAAHSALAGATDDLMRCRAILQVGVAQARSGDFPGAIKSYEQAAGLARPLAAEAGGGSAKYVLAVIFDNLAVVEELAGNSERSSFYQQELLRLRGQARQSDGAPGADPMLASAVEEAQAAIARRAWPSAEAAAFRTLALVRRSLAWRDGDAEKRASLEIPWLIYIGRVLAKEFAVNQNETSSEALHTILIDLVAAQRTVAAQHRVVADNHDYLTDTLLNAGQFDVLIGRFDEAHSFAEEAIATLDARAVERGQDYYAKLKLVQALQLSATASVDSAAVRTSDKSAAAEASARARPLIDRALGMVREFERRYGHLEIAERVEEPLLQLSTRAAFHIGDRAVADRDQDAALEIATRLTNKHPEDADLRLDYWFAVYSKAKVYDAAQDWSKAAQIILPHEQEVPATWKAIVLDLKSHIPTTAP